MQHPTPLLPCRLQLLSSIFGRYNFPVSSSTPLTALHKMLRCSQSHKQVLDGAALCCAAPAPLFLGGRFLCSLRSEALFISASSFISISACFASKICLSKATDCCCSSRWAASNLSRLISACFLASSFLLFLVD